MPMLNSMPLSAAGNFEVFQTKSGATGESRKEKDADELRSRSVSGGEGV
jgi:hypothetical protein